MENKRRALASEALKSTWHIKVMLKKREKKISIYRLDFLVMCL